ncbi:hypothetical protein ACOZB2_21710 [Pantoea endophytica]|uniref:Uncharacterized protein n=1 Tax=Pantoea sp. BJ2 TaxID=3141322 RepID=A0AAU7U3Z4_9GAMM
MSEIIENTPRLQAIDGVLLTRDYLQRRARARSLEESAKRNALKIIQQAEREAQAIRNTARMEGYEDGILMHMDALCDFLTHLDVKSRALTESLQKKAMVKLETILHAPEVIEPFLSEWFQQCSVEKIGKVEISLNPSRQKLLPFFERYFSDRSIDVSVVTSPDDGYAFRSGEFSLRFSPDRLSSLISEELLNCKGEYNSLFDSMSRGLAENLRSRLYSAMEKSE